MGSLRIVRTADGKIHYDGDLPERHVFSARYIENGGNAAAAEARVHQAVLDNKKSSKADRDAAREALHGVNTDPLFDRDGADVVFNFTDGRVRYRFVGFETNDNGDLNPNAWVYELVK
jgi:hypothetical protein